MSAKVTRSLQALRAWGPRAWLVAVVGSASTALVLGYATVLIPNTVFRRDVPPTDWSYPVWILTSLLTGLLLATYVRPDAGVQDAEAPAGLEEPSSLVGMAGTVAAWFAIGCPVCNKIALLALGYTGALTWFAPLQPWLAAGAVALLAVGLVERLAGQVACPAPAGTVSPATGPGRRTAT